MSNVFLFYTISTPTKDVQHILTKQRGIPDIVLSYNFPSGQISLFSHHSPEVEPVHMRDMVHYEHTPLLESSSIPKDPCLDPKQSLCEKNIL